MWVRLLWLAIYPYPDVDYDARYALDRCVEHGYVQPSVSTLNRHGIEFVSPRSVGRPLYGGHSGFGPEIQIIGRYHR